MIGLGVGPLGLGFPLQAASAFVLSSPTDVALGPTSGTLGVSSTGAAGDLFWVILLTADSTPDGPQIARGVKADNTTAAEDDGSKTVTVSGAQTFSVAPTMLNPETGYKAAFVHRNVAGLYSNVVVADGFTTTAVVVGSAEGGGASTTNPTTITCSIAVAIGDLIVANSSEQVGTAPTVTACTDNLSHTYSTPDADGLAQSTTSGMEFYQIATSAGTLTTVNFAATGSANDIALKVAVYKGPFSSLDAAIALRGDAASPFTGTSSGTLGQASCLAIGTLAGASAGDTHGVSANWTMTGAIASGGARRAAQQHQTLEATTAVQASFTSGSADNTVVGTMVFRRSV